MRKILFLMMIVFCLHYLVSAQNWVSQGTGWTASRVVQNIFIVNPSVVWISADASTGGPDINCQDISRTTNGGITWTPKVINGISQTGNSMICAVDSLTAWVSVYNLPGGTNAGVYKTTDGGNTWARQGWPYMFTDTASFPNVVYFWDQLNGCAIGDPLNGFFEIYVTDDGGSNWTRISNVAADTGETGYIADYSVVCNNIWFGTNRRHVYHSADRGHTWTRGEVAFQSSYKYLWVAMRDSLSGYAMKLWNDSTVALSRTWNGGMSYDSSAYSGTLFDGQLSYIPGTEGYWISSGSGKYGKGISYSFDDGGSFWVTDPEFYNKGVSCHAFYNDSIGWAGVKNTGPGDGIYKRITPIVFNNIPEVESENDIKVYPVPAEDHLHIESRNIILEASLYDETGKQLIHRHLSGKSASIDVSGISPGIYELIINTEKGKSKRVVAVR